MRHQKSKEQVFAEKLNGWSLIRGKPDNLPKFGDYGAVVGVYSQAQDFLSTFSDYWKERLVHADFNYSQGYRNMLLFLFEWRMVGTLDAICATTMVGRPSASAILLRALYENYLNSLLVATDTGPFEKSILRSKKEGTHPSPDQLAERFLQYYYLAMNASVKELAESSSFLSSQLNAPNIQEEIRILEQLCAGAEAEFGFTSGRDGWSPISSLRNLHNHLWPKGSDAKISRLAFTEDYDTWYGLYHCCYLEPCNDIHSVAPSFFKNELQKSKKRVAFASRIWNEDYLGISLKITVLGIRAIADSLGALDLWEQMYN